VNSLDRKMMLNRVRRLWWRPRPRLKVILLPPSSALTTGIAERPCELCGASQTFVRTRWAPGAGAFGKFKRQSTPPSGPT